MTSIKFLVNEVAGGWTPHSKRLGGTEESVVEWAKRLAKDHFVTVYHNAPDDTLLEAGLMNPAAQIDGVDYKPREMYEPDGGITINIKDSNVYPLEKTWYLTNEVNADELDLQDYEAVIFPSEWAKDNIYVNNKVEILPHGYDSSKIKPGKKKKGMCLYASSPDRGYSELEKYWPEIVKQHPEAHLYVTYGATGNLPNTTYVGDASEEEMNKLYAEADLWLHPCLGGELYGITGIKAQASGCVPVYYPTMALAETVKHGFATDPKDFVKNVVSLLENEELKEVIRERMVKDKYVDWDESTTILKRIIGL